MKYTELDLVLSWPLIVLVALSGLAVAYSFWSYRETLPPVAAWKQHTLSVLRSVSLLLILFLLFEPILSLAYQETSRPVVAVLVDQSESMAIPDDRTERDSVVRGLLNNPDLDSLSDHGEIRWYAFSEELVSLDPDSLNFGGQATDMASALESLKNEMTGRPLAATILITDGQYNVGGNPATYAGLFGGPIFTVGVGEAKEQKDVFITQVLANEAAYLQSLVPVDVSVSAFGYAGKKLTVSLLQDGRILQTKYLEAPVDGARVRVPFDFTAAAEGMQKFEVRVEKLEGELTDRNNSKLFFIRILKNRMRVRLISGSPGSEHGFLYQTLVDDPNVDVTALVEKKGGGFLQISEPTVSIEGEIDCYVLNNYPTAQTPSSEFQKLASDLMAARKGFMLIVGPDLDLSKLSALQSVSAVEWKTDKALEETSVPISLTLSGRHSAIMKLSDQVSETVAGWGDLPPVWIHRIIALPVAGSDVLARADLSRAGQVLKTRGDIPLIVTRKTATSKSLIVSAYGLWKIHFMVKGLGKTTDAYRTFVANAVRWLSTMEDSRPVMIAPSKRVYRNGERILITAQVHDEAFRPISDAVVRVDATGASGKIPLQLTALGNGRYEGTLEGLPVGDYSLEGEALRGEYSLGKDKGQLTVEEYSVELLNTSLNEPLLRSIATQSGGSYEPAERFGEIVRRIHLEPIVSERRREFEIWNTTYLLFVLAALLAAEWWIRKRNDMM